MRFSLWVATVAASVLLSFPVYAMPPVEAFGNLPEATDARLSPNGKRIAIIKPVDGHNKVVIYDLSQPEGKPYVVGMEGGVAGEMFWKNNNRLICVFHATLKRRGSMDTSAWSRAISVDPDTQTATLMMYNIPFFRANFDAGYVADLDADDPHHVMMPAYNRWDRALILDLYTVELETGAAQLALHGNVNTVGFLTDGHGHILGHVDQDASLTDHVVLGEKDVYQFGVRGVPEFALEGLTAKPTPSQVVKRLSRWGTSGLYSWSPAGIGDALYENPEFDVTDTLTDEHDSRIIGVTYVDDMQRTKYFDQATQHVQELLEKAYPGQSVSILSMDQARSAFAIRTDGPRNAPVLSLYTPANRQANIIQEAYPSLKPADLGEVKSYPYSAQDGLQIHAYLTLPPGKAPHNLPTVIFPHGGPEDRDSMNFDWWAQFMASRGYAVLQPNYRGSSGYGWDFIKAGDGEWAGKVQQDLRDGVEKLVADGIADPKRICIVGGSWGGYLALGGVTFEPDLYACAISYAGSSDLAHDFYTGTTFESEVDSLWRRRIGADRDSGKMDEQSPARYAERVKAPVLLIHSDKDITVKIDQSEIEERALRHAGKQVEFVTLEGDDHYLEFADTRMKLLKEVERFLDAHIGDHATPSPAAH